MDFSIVIPAFNEKERLSSFLFNLTEEISKSNLNGEIIIVDDGSRKDDYRYYLNIISRLNNASVRILRHPRNMGKGAAIKTGFKDAKGTWIGFVDADGAISSKEVMRLLKIALSSTDLDGIFGSRVMMLGYNIDRKFMRHLGGRILTTLLYFFLRIPVYDSQCGYKIFRASKILPLINICKEQGYLLDLELITIGYRNKLNFLEVPISWKDIPGGKVNLMIDGWKMLMGLWRIRKRLITMDIKSVSKI